MFQTFYITPESSTEGNTPSPKASDHSSTKRKRKQVARACNLCRSSRTRCDESVPCLGCVSKGAKCSKDGTDASKTLPSALREIERLQQQVTKLRTPSNLKSSSVDVLTSPVTSISSGPVDVGPTEESYWKGVHAQIQSSSQYFGPSSTYAFFARTLAFLNSTSEKPMEISQLVPQIRSEPKTLAMPGSHFNQMPFSQEQLFLNLFWETFHSLTPILSEDDFKVQYMALWVGGERQASPLVDIVLALSIQYGRTFVETDNMGDDISRRYFERCRYQLTELWESPSMEVVQSYIFMVIYLLNSAEFTGARSMLVCAVNTAYVLGLHLKQNVPEGDQDELEYRAWQKLCVLDVKLSMELGLPSCTNSNDSHQTISKDNADTALLNESNFDSSLSAKSWVAEEFKLFEAARNTQEQFSSSISSPHSMDDARELENSAELMSRCLENIRTWCQQLSDGPRSISVVQKSAAPSPPPWTLDTSIPFGMQLQEIFLKLEYHQICLSFHRLFIYFKPHWTAIAPKANNLAGSALNHAIAITNLLHQSLTTSITLNGFYPAYNFQWAAASTIMSFILAYPVCQPTPSARKALPIAIAVLELLGKDIPLALEAVQVLNRLNSRSKSLMSAFNLTLGNIRNVSPEKSVEGFEIPSDVEHMNMLWSEADQYQHNMWTEFVDGLDSAQHFDQYGSDLDFLNTT